MVARFTVIIAVEVMWDICFGQENKGFALAMALIGSCSQLYTRELINNNREQDKMYKRANFYQKYEKGNE